MTPDTSGLACICAIICCSTLLVYCNHLCEGQDLRVWVVTSQVGKVFDPVVQNTMMVL